MPMETFKFYQGKSGGVLCRAPRRACDQCRQKRQRCDRGKPCVCCQRAGEECLYASIPKPRGRPPRLHSREPRPPSPTITETTSTISLPEEGNGPKPNNRPDEVTQQSETLEQFMTDYWINTQIEESAMGWQDVPLNLDTNTVWSTVLAAPRIPGEDNEASCTDSLASGPSYGHTDGYPGGDKDVAAPCPQPSSGLSERAIHERAVLRSYSSIYLSHVELFFERLYPVFPVIDKTHILSLLQSEDLSQPLPSGFAAFLAALSAAVIVQLNLVDVQTLESPLDAPHGLLGSGDQSFSAPFFVSQCLEARRSQDFVENANEWTVLTSFFLFAYYGNLNQSRLAWYYLRESIGFAQMLGMDDPEFYVGIDAKTSQRCRRLFWLLFISERYVRIFDLSAKIHWNMGVAPLTHFFLQRAYSIQHRRKSILSPSIELPRVFDSDEPQLIFGFVTLAKVFSTVHDEFLTAWVGQKFWEGDDSNSNHQLGASLPMPQPLGVSSTAGTVSPSEIGGIQRVDIAITQQWLRVLTCQLNMRRSPAANPGLCSQYVMESSKNMLHTLMSSGRHCVEAHGIGMVRLVLFPSTLLRHEDRYGSLPSPVCSLRLAVAAVARKGHSLLLFY